MTKDVSPRTESAPALPGLRPTGAQAGTLHATAGGDRAPSRREAHVRAWIARNRRRLRAGLFGGLVLGPLLADSSAAEAETGGFLRLQDLPGVRAITPRPDGGVRLTLEDGRVLHLGPSAVVTLEDGTLAVRADVLAGLLPDAAAGEVAADDGTAAMAPGEAADAAAAAAPGAGATALSGGVAALGAGAAAVLAAAAGGAGGGSGGGATPPAGSDPSRTPNAGDQGGTSDDSTGDGSTRPDRPGIWGPVTGLPETGGPETGSTVTREPVNGETGSDERPAEDPPHPVGDAPPVDTPPVDTPGVEEPPVEQPGGEEPDDEGSAVDDPDDRPVAEDDPHADDRGGHGPVLPEPTPAEPTPTPSPPSEPSPTDPVDRPPAEAAPEDPVADDADAPDDDSDGEEAQAGAPDGDDGPDGDADADTPAPEQPDPQRPTPAEPSTPLPAPQEPTPQQPDPEADGPAPVGGAAPGGGDDDVLPPADGDAGPGDTPTDRDPAPEDGTPPEDSAPPTAPIRLGDDTPGAAAQQVVFDSPEETLVFDLRGTRFEDSFVISAPNATRIELRGDLRGQEDRVVLRIQDPNPGQTDIREITIVSELAGEGNTLVFEFAGAEDRVRLSPDSVLRGFSTLEVVNGTLDVAGVTLPDGLAFVVNSGLVLTLEQFLSGSSVVSVTGHGKITLALADMNELDALLARLAEGTVTQTLIGATFTVEVGGAPLDEATLGIVRTLFEALSYPSIPDLTMRLRAVEEEAGKLPDLLRDLGDIEQQLALLALAGDGDAEAMTAALMAALSQAQSDVDAALNTAMAQTQERLDQLSAQQAALFQQADFVTLLALGGNEAQLRAMLLEQLQADFDDQKLQAQAELLALLMGGQPGDDLDARLGALESVAMAAPWAPGQQQLLAQMTELDELLVGLEAAQQTASAAYSAQLAALAGQADATLAAAVQGMEALIAALAGGQQELATRISGLDALVAGLEAALQTVSEDLGARIATLRDAATEALEAAVDALDARIAALANGQDDLADRLSGLEGLTADLDAALQGASGTLSAQLSLRLDAVESALSEIRSDLGALRDVVETTLFPTLPAWPGDILFREVGEIFDGNALRVDFLSEIDGFDPATVPIGIRDPLTVAQARVLADAGFDMTNGVGYEIADHVTNVQAAMADARGARLLAMARPVTAHGNALDNHMDFGALPAHVRLVIRGEGGDDTILASPGNDRILPGTGRDVVQLLPGEGQDSIVWEAAAEGGAPQRATLRFAGDPHAYVDGGTLSLRIDGALVQTAVIAGAPGASLAALAAAVMAEAGPQGSGALVAATVEGRAITLTGRSGGQPFALAVIGGQGPALTDPGVAAQQTVTFSADPAVHVEGGALRIVIDGNTYQVPMVPGDPQAGLEALRDHLEVAIQNHDLWGLVNQVEIDPQGMTLTLTGDGVGPAAFAIAEGALDLPGVRQLQQIAFSSDPADYIEGSVLEVVIDGTRIAGHVVPGDPAASVAALRHALEHELQHDGPLAQALARVERVATAETAPVSHVGNDGLDYLLQVPGGEWPQGGLTLEVRSFPTDDAGGSFSLPAAHYLWPSDLTDALNIAFEDSTGVSNLFMGWFTSQDGPVLRVGVQHGTALRELLSESADLGLIDIAISTPLPELRLLAREVGPDPYALDAAAISDFPGRAEQRELVFGADPGAYFDGGTLELTVSGDGLDMPVTLTADMVVDDPAASLEALRAQIMSGLPPVDFVIFPDLVDQTNHFRHHDRGADQLRTVDLMGVGLQVFTDGGSTPVFATLGSGSTVSQFLTQLMASSLIDTAEILPDGGLRIVTVPEVERVSVGSTFYRYLAADDLTMAVTASGNHFPVGAALLRPEFAPLFEHVAVVDGALVFTAARPGAPRYEIAGAIDVAQQGGGGQSTPLPEAAQTVLVPGVEPGKIDAGVTVASEGTAPGSLAQTIDAEARPGVFAFATPADVAQTAAEGPDIVRHFDLAEDVVLFDGLLAEALLSGHTDRIAAASDGSSTPLDLALHEFALVDHAAQQALAMGPVGAAELGDSARVAQLVGALFDVTATDVGMARATVFAITAADDPSQTALWVHEKAAAGDVALAPGLTHLATLHTTPGGGAEMFGWDHMRLANDYGPAG